jgi:DNA topoisomerase-1
VRKFRNLPGRALFQYAGADGTRQCVDSAEVNAYLKEITGRSFTAKNFRTWAGTVLAAQAFCDLPASGSEAAFQRSVARAIDRVAEKLGNTRAVCRRCYVHPGVLEAFLGGVTIANISRSAGPSRSNFSAAEAAVLALLKRGAHRPGAPVPAQAA